jgi:ABC-2 type transport system ATP-binding protein
VFGLLGPNGAGKSTAVKILTTLARPDAGEARVTGLDVVARPEAVRRAIGVVAQGSGVDVQATGRENLELQGRLFGLRGRELRARADGLVTRLGLAASADRIAKGYSGGMLRRLDIAMALIHRPRVLFLDEPTTGLDPEVRSELWSMIGSLTADEGLTVLLTTHYLEEADQLAARLAIVDRGRVVAAGTPEELKSQLRGDAVEVELASPYDGVASGAVGAIAGVREVAVDGRVLRARADDGGRTVPAVLSALEGAGVRVTAVRVARPSLDDVYLKATGRTFEAAESAMEVASR